MDFQGIVIPMRCQPLHYGHIRCIKAFSVRSEEVRIFLCRDFGDEDNPFPMDMRIHWIEKVLRKYNLRNVRVVQRSAKPIARKQEYGKTFSVGSIVVVTTNETNSMYVDEGFVTFNHHDPKHSMDLYGDSPEKIHSIGRIIRDRLRQGLPCQEFLPHWVESEAVLYLRTKQ